MSGSSHEAVVSRLRTLNNIDPQQAMDAVDDLIEGTSIKDLAQILGRTFPEISEELGIDWRFTAMQWKLGNRGCEEFIKSFPEARFKVWSLPFRGGASDDLTQTRYTTCLPFQLKEELASSHMSLRTH
jgi:hypothetical protein